jgi:hypothetical protein
VDPGDGIDDIMKGKFLILPVLEPRALVTQPVASHYTDYRMKIINGDVRYQVSTAATLKNAVFWDIKIQFVPQMKHHVSATEPSRR